MSLRSHPTWNYSLVFGLLALALALWLGSLELAAPWAWLAAVSVVTFVAFGYDKLIAARAITRVPERVLIGLAFVGGTLGALAGMSAFRHKTIKGSFRTRFFVAVVVQLLALVLWLSWPRLTGGAG